MQAILLWITKIKKMGIHYVIQIVINTIHYF